MNPRSPLGLLLTLAWAAFALAGFGLPFYIGVGLLGWKSNAASAFLGLTGTVPGLLSGWYLSRFFRAPPAHGAATAADAEARERREARHRAAVEALASDPRYARWSALIRQRGFANEDLVRQYEVRWQALERDPKRRHHQAQLLRGSLQTDQQLDYVDDPSLLLTCVHLRPVEQAIRAAGIACWAKPAGAFVGVAVVFDEARLRARFVLAACVELHVDDHNPHLGPEELLQCRNCNSHLDASGGGTPFP